MPDKCFQDLNVNNRLFSDDMLNLAKFLSVFLPVGGGSEVCVQCEHNKGF